MSHYLLVYNRHTGKIVRREEFFERLKRSVDPSVLAERRCHMTSAARAVRVVSALPQVCTDEASALVFEYMAATQAETGHPVPVGINDLPAVLQHECRNLRAFYHSPGAMLIAYHGDQPAGCVGLAPCSAERTAEIKRLYVRPAHRGQGIARVLMGHVHHHAAQHGIARLILDVLPASTAVIGFYRRLGYFPAEDHATESLVPMICMERPVTSGDILSIRPC
jgi:GNAT superfamily N-acetyltransferase